MCTATQANDKTLTSVMPLTGKNGFVLDYLLPSDASDIGALFFASFHTYPFFQHMMPDTPNAHQGWTDSTLAALDDPHTIALKVTDPATNKIVAHGRWVKPVGPGETCQPGHEAGRWTEGFMKACDEKLAGEMFGTYDRMREQLMSDKAHYYMELLLTHPDYQGKGLASLILRHGLALADHDQIPCYIDSSPLGKPVYERFGWKFETSEKFDHDITYYFGIREAKRQNEG